MSLTKYLVCIIVALVFLTAFPYQVYMSQEALEGSKAKTVDRKKTAPLP